MQIERIRLRRFKSLYDTEVPLQCFTAITGPNGSGKSNFAAALDFLGETYSFGVEYAIGRAGGIDAIAYRRRRRTTVPVEFEIRFRLDSSDELLGMRRLRGIERGQSMWFTHRFGLRPSDDLSDANFSVAYDSIKVELGRPGDDLLSEIVTIESRSTEESRTLNVHYGDTAGFQEVRDYLSRRVTDQLELDLDAERRDILAPTELTTDAFRSVPFIREFRTAARALKVYRLNPSACRTPGVFLPSAALERDGSNLPGVVERMRRNARKDGRPSLFRLRNSRAWDSLIGSMAEIFPSLVDIGTKISTAGGLDLQISERGVGRPWSSNEVSDGTICYLALLTVMFDTSNPIIVIEEPENALHSWLLRIFIERARRLEDRQVIFTTHSPVALKSVRPPELLLAWKRNGRTTIAPLTSVDPGALELYEEKGVDVYEQYDSGFLPETMPPGEETR